MKKIFDQVGEFDKAFGIPEQSEPSHSIPDDDRLLYYKLSREENEEYLDAVISRDLKGVADALGDELYVIIGKFRKHGISAEQAEKIIDEIHLSNMSKLGREGRPLYREDGKVLKGENYFEPNIEKCLS